MLPKTFALPRSPFAIAQLASVQDVELEMNTLLKRRREMAFQLELIDVQLQDLAFSTCGVADESQHVEMYDGSLGVTRAFVDQYEPPVGQLQWLDDLGDRFTGPRDSPGNVSSVRWGSGALISRSLFLTAGHCFDQFGNTWVRPVRNDRTIEPEEMATLMRVNFKFQLDGVTGELRLGEPFPVVALREYRNNQLDYAVVELGPDSAGRLPGDRFGWLSVAAADLRTPGSRLCVIQHPNRREKMIEAGNLLGNASGIMTYNDIDALGGSSGSPILSQAGEIVGIHVKGGCTPLGGANRGQAIGVIRAASSLI